ncbi:MAG: filamentous hemagglutinin N-terminal domain-containing protein [Leptolyngbyaceae cyanobacterium]
MILHSYRVLILSLYCALLLSRTASAQTMTPDATVNTVVSPLAGNQFTVTGGTIRGDNLFHSFTTFSPQDWATHFDLADGSYGGSAVAISRIIGRVTGNDISSIDGILQVSGGNFPDLFLINPNGILFGPNARLNIPGSFIASTADSLNFADGITFAANDTTANPLLTITAPIGLNLPGNPAPIQVEGNGHNLGLFAENPVFGPTIPGMEMTGLMTVVPGQTLGLLGGKITLKGGTVTAVDGRVELGAVGDNRPTQVGLSPTLPGWQFDYSGVESFGDITLRQQAAAYASGITTPGSMQLVGRQITLTDGSMAVFQGFGPVPGGGLWAIASEGINVIGTAPATLRRSQIRTEALGTGQGADLSIVAPLLQVQSGGRVDTSSFADGDSGNLTIQATSAVEVTGFAPGLPQMFTMLSSTTLGSGDTGDLTVNTAKLSTQEGAYVSVAAFFGTGNAGDITINATERVEVIGSSPVFPSALNANSLSEGNASSLVINTQQLVVRDGGVVGTQAFASGSGGDVVIRASEFVEVTGGSPTIVGISPTVGLSQIGANVIITSDVSALFGLSSTPTGQAGSVDIVTPRLSLSEGGLISVQNQGTGDSGTLQIAVDQLLLDSGASIIANTAFGEGGNIELQAQDLLLLQNDSLLSAEAGGDGNGGNITIDSPTISGFDNSDIVANAVFGNGGNIQISTQAIFGLELREDLTPESDITASSQFGVSGTVAISDLEVDPRSEAAELTTEFADPSLMIAQGCGTQIQGNEFIVTGQGGVAPTPTALLTSEHTWQDVRDPSVYLDGAPVDASVATVTQMPPFAEINSWQRTPDGQVKLIAVEPAPGVAYPYLSCNQQPVF